MLLLHKSAVLAADGLRSRGCAPYARPRGSVSDGIKAMRYHVIYSILCAHICLLAVVMASTAVDDIRRDVEQNAHRIDDSEHDIVDLKIASTRIEGKIDAVTKQGEQNAGHILFGVYGIIGLAVSLLGFAFRPFFDRRAKRNGG